MEITLKTGKQVAKDAEKDKKKNEALAVILQSKTFYDLMQRYRHVPIADQVNASKAYDAVRMYLFNEISKL